MELRELIINCMEKQDNIAALEGQVKKLKEEVADLKQQILSSMQSQELQNVKYHDCTVLITKKSHYEIADKEKFAYAMLRSLVETLNNGKNILDGFIAQFRPSKETFENYINQDTHTIDDTGVRQIDKSDITIRRP